VTDPTPPADGPRSAPHPPTDRLDPAFAADCPYGPGGLLLDAIVDLDVAAGRVVGRMPTHAELPLTREQRAHPVRHPRHVSGGLMVHMTGMMGFAHAYYVLGLRHGDGWIGYGGRIYKARYLKLALPGEPLFLACEGTQIRRAGDKIFGRYAFRFTQDGAHIYESEQSALWMKVGD